MSYAQITGWGKCVPPAVLSNSDLEHMMDTSDEWITTRTGIKERRISHVENSDMATVAAHRALAAAGKTPDDVDLIVAATCTPDRMIPALAVMVQEKLGARPVGAFDINAACSGFIYALATVDQMVRSGGARTALVIGSEKLHYWLDFTNRNTAVLFGDGAGAVVVEPSAEEAGVLSYELGADGSLAGILCLSGMGTEGDVTETDLPHLHMDGPEVFRRAVTTMGDASVRVVEKAGLDLDDVDLLIPHQANVRIIDATARRLKLPPEQVFVNIASYGNTSAATIPIALTEAIEEGRVQAGNHIVFAAFGGGLTWSAAVVKWGPRTEPVRESDVTLPAYAGTAVDLIQPNIEAYGLAARD